MDWLIAFTLTVAVETPILFTVACKSDIKTFSGVFIANLTSHLLLWFVLPTVVARTYYPLIGELSVVLIEYFVLRVLRTGIEGTRLFSAVILMNATSYIVGENIYQLIGG